MTVGRFGKYGGAYVPETLVPALQQVEDALFSYGQSEEFLHDYTTLLADYVGRPTPLTSCNRLASSVGLGTLLLKREDLCHTGAHKINNCIGQILLAQHLGKKRIIAETGAGQHGVATATVCARFGLECTIYMGAEDVERQHLNVVRMQILGAQVVPVDSGSRTLKDATNEAIRDWVSTVNETHYIIGSAVGPHPYPTMVREFQKIIGEETKKQLRELDPADEFPDAVVACVGGGSNAIGMFYPFLEYPSVKMFGVEADGTVESHAATLSKGKPGVLHGSYSYLLQDPDGQVAPVHSISAGLDYPGVGPEHAYLKDTGRITYLKATDLEALHAVRDLSRLEGIIPALETAHAIAALRSVAEQLGQDATVVVCCSGRGDKDMATIAQHI